MSVRYSRILSEYYYCTDSSLDAPDYQNNDAQLHELINLEKKLIQRADKSKIRGKVEISKELYNENYRLYLKIDLKQQNANCTTLYNVVVNPKASFLDRLLIKSSNLSRTGSSSRIVMVMIDINKNTIRSQTTENNIDSKFLDIAKNGIIYANDHYQFLLSKDPKSKMAYFLRDDDESFFPNAAAFRRYIADFSRQPTVSRAGTHFLDYIYTCIYIYMYKCVYMYTYIYTYVYIYVHIYI
jgi:hypothetical protein